MAFDLDHEPDFGGGGDGEPKHELSDEDVEMCVMAAYMTAKHNGFCPACAMREVGISIVAHSLTRASMIYLRRHGPNDKTLDLSTEVVSDVYDRIRLKYNVYLEAAMKRYVEEQGDGGE